MNVSRTRILLSSSLFISVFLLPWWVAVVLALALTARTAPYEVLVAGFLLDRVYGSAISSVGGFALPIEVQPVIFTLLFATLFFVSIVIKKFLIFYKPHA